jgi:glycosyltransferase involved in cell wall biosynthesis
MLILLDCRPLQYAGPGSERSRLILAAAAALAGDKAVKWLFVVDHTFRPGMLDGISGDSLLVRRALPGSFGWRWWYDRQIPRLARQYQADMVMLTGGITAKLSGVPQCLWMPERANPGENGNRRFYPSIYRTRLVAGLQRAAVIFCFTGRDRDWLAGSCPGIASGKPSAAEGVEEKILVLPAAMEEDAGVKGPLGEVEKQEIKKKYARGREYFLADLADAVDEDVIYLLKAFSLFKKRQQSNMQLILTGAINRSAGMVRQRLKTYKYREDVHWQEDLPTAEAGQLSRAAYAALLLFDGHTLGAPLLNAWAAAVPVITMDGSLLQEIAGDAALLAGAGDPASLAAQLMRIYKDENGRMDLIRRGFDRRGAYSRRGSIDVLWEGIGKVFRPMN